MEGKPCQPKLAVLFLYVVVGQESSIRAKEENTPYCVETSDDFPNSFYVIARQRRASKSESLPYGDPPSLL